jgi:tRNA 2-(methylsulfanyl)-N6-isopentenyladenosine37 hydroxylase
MTKEINEFLPCRTPDAWLRAAPAQLEILLIDHADCEKKAASTALGLMFRYRERPGLQEKMSRLAREELRHFEQVMSLMKQRGIHYRPISASRYAAGLQDLVRRREPGRLVDILVAGAFIEARSCERFEKLAPRLDEALGDFYRRLLKSEARHFRDYLTLAEEAAGGTVDDRVALFAQREAELISLPDPQFRFHSGVPDQSPR